MVRGGDRERADAGFAVPALYDYCEEEGIAYTVGLIANPHLRALAEGCWPRPKKTAIERAKR